MKWKSYYAADYCSLPSWIYVYETTIIFFLIKTTVILAAISIFLSLNPLMAQNRDSSHSFAYDSISITKEQRYDIKYLLTASSIEVVCEDYDLASLYGVAPELNHLFDQLKSALPARAEHKMREELEGDYGSFYDIKVFNRGKNMSTIRILYECDYPYLSPSMFDYINTLNQITQYYNSFLGWHFEFERKMTSSLEKTILGYAMEKLYLKKSGSPYRRGIPMKILILSVLKCL